IGEQNTIVKQRPTPKLTITSKGRAFQESWYAKKDWLCGSSALKKLFCWPCLLFCPGKSPTWTKSGYNDMHGFLSDFKKHERSNSHMGAFKTWKMYGAGVRVDSLISQARRDEIQRHNEEVRQNREILKTITEAVLYLSRQESAFRGHDESEDSLSRGNYRELLESFAKFDSVFERRLHGRLAESERGGVGGGRFTGVSPEIQNDLINCLDSIIEDEIFKEINDCTFMSVQVDETSDVSTKEQVSMIARLDKGSEIVERQLGFVDVSSNRNAAAITQVIKDKLSQHSGIKDKLIMQTYDGAAVMSGHINGVQVQVRQEYPFAHFVHCAAHRLNLVLCQSASSISPIKIFFVNVGAFSTFINNALKRKAFLTSHKIELPNPGDTRWYYRARVINVLHKNYENLLEIFEGVVDQPVGWDDETLDKSFVSSLRSDEAFDEFYQEAVDKVGPPISRADTKHNYKQLYFEILDSIVGMLNERFQDMERFGFLDLVNPKVFATWGGVVPPERINLLKQTYGPLFDVPMLENQLSFIYRDKDFHKETSDELLKYIFKFNLQSSTPEAVKLLKMNGVLSIASASVERSFSCLKRVKGYLRNTMGQGRLSSLCRISIHKDIVKLKEDDNVLHEEVIKKFVEKPRLLAFLYK
ncbi:zinc finger MYM-type 1-like, partial [Paramuricea clavata]